MQPNKFLDRGPQRPSGQPDQMPSFSQPEPKPVAPPIVESVAKAANAVSSAASAVSSAANTAASAVSNSAAGQQLKFGPDGKIRGLDGVLDQIFESMGKQVGPIVTEKALPIILRDRGLQRELGVAAGRGIGKEIKPWVAVGAIRLAAIAGVMAYKAYKKYGRS